ncbi:hypothetical protein C8024_10015 [Sphingopyxis sp. BSNA05]|nr:hypothetical protein [Sphingopyxis sp. BSNA05]
MLTYVKEKVGIVVGDENEIAIKMLSAVGHELSIACGFEQIDTWSISIQRPAKETEDGIEIDVLKPIANKRAVDCDISRSRSWPIDVGVTGRVFQTKEPVRVGDMTDAAVQSALGHEAVQPNVYRSIFATPIIPDGMDDCWGVVIATSDEADHFRAHNGPDQSHYEPLVQFAALIELALGIRDLNIRCPDDPPVKS